MKFKFLLITKGFGHGAPPSLELQFLEKSGDISHGIHRLLIIFITHLIDPELLNLEACYECRDD